MTTIKKLRDRIDKIDENIIKKLSQRKILSEKVGELKLKLSRNIIDHKREEQLIKRYKKLSDLYHLQPEFVLKLFKIIMRNSRKLQK